MKIAICDDDITMVENIETLIYENDNVLNTDVFKFLDGDELYESINNGTLYDLIYLDIEMSRLGGVEVARKIREIDKSVKIIFVTAYSEFAISTYEVSAFRYMLKPVDKIKFKEYYNLVKDAVESEQLYFSFKFGRENFRIDIRDIICFESEKRVTNIRTKDGDKKCYEKLNSIEKRLLEKNVKFFRTSQSFLLNPKYIYKYTSRHITLTNNVIVDVARSKSEKISEMFCDLKCGDINV